MGARMYDSATPVTLVAFSTAPAPCERASRAVAVLAGAPYTAQNVSRGPLLSSVDGADDGAERGGHDVRVDSDAPTGFAVDRAFHVRGSLGVLAGRQRVLGVVEHPYVHAHA